MKKMVTAAIAVLFTGFSIVIQAAPQQNTWYVGSKMGWSRYYKTDVHDYTYAPNDGSTSVDSFAKNLFLGYQITPRLATELGLDTLGNIIYSGKKVSGNFKAYDLQLSTKLSYPIISNKLDVYTRLGGLIWHARATQFTEQNNNRMHDNDGGISPFLAAGIEYAVNKDIGIRLDYQFVKKVGDKNIVGSEPSNGFLTIGLSYKFGQEPYDSTTIPVSKNLSINNGIKVFNLKSDVLFNFDKFALKKEGKETLDTLYNKLKCSNQKNDIIVIGFTDRIGSIKYNYKLSKKRAQSVVNYLVMKGIPSSSISINNLGKSNPITKNTCDNIEKRKDLIECLAPDRRVEIQINSVKNITNHFKS
ncbi:porin OmpA [Pantoea sp. SoEX]|uniref:porin OmpA n=1 Tax=Pantoea sp. SoEX TaxID=2576763 RepID=UPI00135A1721|nr:porin OmpA [Pantoea sp. SoEX]MXP51012.1 porin OmpA [Pantoea sp. SoEX]